MSSKGAKISKISDEKLAVTYAKTGREEYGDEIFRRYLPLVYGYFLGYASAEGAAELVRDFRTILKSQLRNDTVFSSGFRNWIYNEASDFIAARGGKLEHTGFNAAEAAYVRALASGDKKAKEAFEAALPLLNRSERECLSKFFIDKMSFADIADDAGLLLNNIRDYIESGIRVIIENNGAR